MIRHKKLTIFIDAKESTSVLDLKKMIMGITKKAPNEMRLFKDETVNSFTSTRQLVQIGCF